MQEVAEYLLAVVSITSGLEDMKAPESVDVGRRRCLLIRKHFHQAQKATVVAFDGCRLFRAPAAAGAAISLFLIGSRSSAATAAKWFSAIMPGPAVLNTTCVNEHRNCVRRNSARSI